MNDQERVEKLSSEALGGMTEEIASQLYGLLDHEDDSVVRKAFGAFEYGPKDDEERQQIQYDRVVGDAARILRENSGPETEVEQRVYDTLSFILDDHAPRAVDSFDERDREWVRELLDHDIYVFRELGCRILGQIGDQTDVNRLEDAAATDESEEVREAAQAAIEKIE